MNDAKSTETVIHAKLLPNSLASTGLDDLLISRTVSEGGYDSDARGIHTPSWTKASAGSVLVSPEYTAKVLDAFDTSPSRRSASLPRTPRHGGENRPSPADLSQTPSTRTKGNPGLERLRPVGGDGRQIRVRATSSPMKPATPRREFFSALLQLRPQESPTDVLRRLSVGLANGTIKLPDTPELKAMRMPSIVEAMPEWRLSFAAPKRASSLHRCDFEVRQALKTLSDRVEKAKRDSTASGWTISNKHDSLLTNLDPALLEYISRYSDEEQASQPREPVGDTEESDKGRRTSKDSFDRDTTPHADTSGVHERDTAQLTYPVHKANTSSSDEPTQPYTPGLESEKESVHLFDMRISQRLASTSILPTQAPSITNLGSLQSGMDRSSQRFGKLDRFPTFIGQTSGEHLRRPSDPRTKRLFEPESLVDGRKLHPKWKSVMSAGSLNPEKPSRNGEASRDDASSVYMSDAGLEDSDIRSINSHRTRSNPRPIPSSLAVAGRQGTSGLPNDRRRNSMGQMLNKEGRTKINLIRSLSDVKGKESKFSEEFDVPKKTMTGKIESEGANTLADEGMSMVDFWSTNDSYVDQNERMSEEDFVGALSEKLKFSVRGQQDRKACQLQNTSEASQQSMGHGMSTGDHLTGLARGNVDANHESKRTIARGRDECATNMWERALRTAREDTSLASSGENFGTSFGQRRRDQSRKRRQSDSRPSREHTNGGLTTVSIGQNRSLSPDPDPLKRPQRGSFNLDRHQSLCVEAKKPLTRSTSPARSLKNKKKSLLDIRRFTAVGHSNNDTAKSSPASPARDFLAWARLPSHTRLERNGAAADKDGVSSKDFSPPTNTETPLSSKNRSKLSLMTQPDNAAVHTPGAWRFIKFGHGRKKSRSMNFAVFNPSHRTETEKAKMTKESSMRTLTNSLAQWGRLYRSHSSDLRRFRTGHRSSVSKGGKVEFPELEIVPGYDGGNGNGGRVRMEELGDFEKERRRWDREMGRGRGRSKGGFDGVVEGMERRVTDTEKSVEEVNVAGDGSEPWSGSKKSPSREKTGEEEEQEQEQTPTKYQNGAAAKSGNTWADIYQACVIRDNDESDRGTVSPSPCVPGSDESTTTANHQVSQRQLSDSRTGEGDDSYISCSVDMSDDLPYRSTDMDNEGCLGSADGLRAGKRARADQEESKQRLVSSCELRDSTVDFRTQLLEEETRVRELLMGMARH